MSSPLSFFRRNQKVLLAVFGVLIMLTFVVGDYVSRYQSRGRGDSKPEVAVVTWKHGKLYDRDLWAVREAHNLAVRFLDVLVQKTIEAKGQPKGLGVTIMNGRVFDPGIPRSYAEEDLVQTMIMAKKAEELGVRISDDAIFEFLDTLSDDVVPRSQFGVLLNEATNGRFAKAQLFEQLRTELLAQHMRMMSGSGLFAMSPSLAWDAFNRMNRQVKVELLPLMVDDYTSQVKGEPAEAEIAALYEQGKSRYPSPDSPEPGFKSRRKIAFQYLKADFEKFLQQEMASLTKEQIEEYYEKNKNDFKVEPKTEPAKPAEAKPAEAKPAEAKPAEAKPAEAKPAESPAADSKPVESKSVESKPESAKPGDSPPAESAKPAVEPTPKEPAVKEAELDLDAPKSSPPPAPEGESKQSCTQPAQQSLVGRVVSSRPTARRPLETMFVSYNAEESAEAKPASEPAPVAAPPAEAPKQESAPAKPDEAKKEPPPVQYKPLAEVEQEIRRNLARAPAQDKVKKAIDGAREEVRKYFQTHASWRAQSKSKQGLPEPTPPDVKKLAEKHGLISGETPPVDELKIGDYELGKAYRFNFAGNQFRRESFAEIAYGARLPLYQPDQIRSFEVDVEFLYWKTKEEEPFVPELKDIQKDVVAAWKRLEAYKLAKQEAEQLAKKAQGDKPLGESLGESLAKKVLTPPEFTWLTRGSMPMGSGAPMLNVVEGVPYAGDEFMRAVFGLQPSQVGTAENAPHSAVYVVRLVSESPDEELRRKQFIEGGLTGEMGYLARMELQRFLTQWNSDLEKEMQVKWSRSPEVPQAVE